MKKIIGMCLLIIFTACQVYATTYWVDDNGTKTVATDCDGETPLSGTDACTLAAAKGFADDDDVVYLRAGTYYFTDYGINPTNSGSAGHPITFSGYESEEVILSGATDNTGRSSMGVNLTNKSYIKITKITFQNLYRFGLISASDHNEISYCTFQNERNHFSDYYVTGTITVADATGVTATHAAGSATPTYDAYFLYNATDKSVCEVDGSKTTTTSYSCYYFAEPDLGGKLMYGTDNKWEVGDSFVITLRPYYGSFYVRDSSTHNWFHHNTFRNYGSYTWRDDGVIFQIGIEDSTTDASNYNTVEFNHMYAGGHHVFAANSGRYNVIRNNYIHNESWYDDSSIVANGCGAGLCGYRVVSASAGANYGGRSLWENNNISYGAAYGGPHLSGVGASGSGTSLSTSYNIYRYNDHVFNALYGLRFSTSLGNSVGNRAYNNTFYSNGYGADDDTVALSNPDYRGGIYMLDGQCSTIGDGGANHVVKNNLFYNQWASSTDNTGTQYPPVYEYNDGYPTAKPNCNVNFGGQQDRTDPKFTDGAIPANSAAIIAAWSSYAVTTPDLTLQSSSTAIDAGTYLTTVHADDTGTGTSLILTDASYFQAGSSAATTPMGSSLSTVAGDYIKVGATLAAAEEVQITDINYTTNTVTVASFTREDGDYVWLSRKSDSGVVLYGDAPDYGAHEFDAGEGSNTVTVSLTGAGCSLSITGEREVAAEGTLSVTATINNGWQLAWSGTCPQDSGTTTRVCTPSGDNQTMIATCTEIKLMPW